MAKARTAGFGKYAIRMAMGIPAKRASGYNSCIGASLRGKKYSKPAPGQGGRNNEQVRSAFKAAVNSCK